MTFTTTGSLLKRFDRPGSPDRAADGFVYPRYTFKTPRELAMHIKGRHRVVIVGAGMVGLTAAADLGARGYECVVLDDNNTVATGSRAISQARRSLQIWDRVGAAEKMTEKGLQWNFARQLFGDRVVNDVELHPEKGHKFPPMMILPQYYVESFLVERCAAMPLVELRWNNSVRGVRQLPDSIELEIDTPEGSYQLEADWVLAADGVKSTIRGALGLSFEGTKIEDRFVIVDVKVQDDFPPGRSFWFQQKFHEGNSTLFLRQPDDVCRVDFNIGPDADAAEEMKPEKVLTKLKAMFGAEKEFDIKWISLYTVEVRRLNKFRHGRVIFMGDAAHQLSPFSGGRGGNSGIEDADNLCWKLSRVLDGDSPETLLDSYDTERLPIADENMRFSLRATEFISPSSGMSAAFQEAALTLSTNMSFARGYLNSGRFSTCSPFALSPLKMPDVDGRLFGIDRLAPGSAAVDAPVVCNGTPNVLMQVLGMNFCLIAGAAFSEDQASRVVAIASELGVKLKQLVINEPNGREPEHRQNIVDIVDIEGLVAERYGLGPGSLYLLRPDQRIVGRWKAFDEAVLANALATACGRELILSTSR
jgi:3-(3-hydroxy-phenyl)propionate hydroxylase